MNISEILVYTLVNLITALTWPTFGSQSDLVGTDQFKNMTLAPVLKIL